MNILMNTLSYLEVTPNHCNTISSTYPTTLLHDKTLTWTPITGNWLSTYGNSNFLHYKLCKDSPFFMWLSYNTLHAILNFFFHFGWRTPIIYSSLYHTWSFHHKYGVINLKTNILMKTLSYLEVTPNQCNTISSKYPYNHATTIRHWHEHPSQETNFLYLGTQTFFVMNFLEGIMWLTYHTIHAILNFFILGGGPPIIYISYMTIGFVPSVSWIKVWVDKILFAKSQLKSQIHSFL